MTASGVRGDDDGGDDGGLADAAPAPVPADEDGDGGVAALAPPPSSAAQPREIPEAIELSYAGGALSSALSPAFARGVDRYDVEVGLWIDRIQIAVTAAPRAHIAIGGVAVASGVRSAPIPLNLALTTIRITIDDGDSGDGDADGDAIPGPRSYVLNVQRAPQVLQRAYGKASNSNAGDHFAASIALCGNTLVVGAPGEASHAVGVNGDAADNSSADSGAAYVFVRRDGAWTQEAYLKASNTQNADRFGQSVAIWGDTIAVGASGEDSLTQSQFDSYGPSAGAVYVFVRSDGAWAQQAFLKASNRERHDYFGSALALWRDTLVVGAPREDSDADGVDGEEHSESARDSGAVYVFGRSNELWSQRAYVKAAESSAGDGFGAAVSAWGDRFAVGAWAEDGAGAELPDSGAAYVFARVGASWVQEARLTATNAGAGDWFGASLALSGETLAVGAPHEDSDTDTAGDPADNNAPGAGAAYVFVRTDDGWAQQAYLKALHSQPGDHFGAVALWGDLLAIGAAGDDDPGAGFPAIDTGADRASRSGSSHIFLRRAGVWTYEAFLKASNAGPGDLFGAAVTVWGDTVIAGAPAEASAAAAVDGAQDDNTAVFAGAFYVFR